MKKYNKVFTTLILIVVVLSGIVVYQNNFKLERKNITIKTDTNELQAVLTMPKKKSDIKGVVVFVHGDGPITASYSEGYYPVWERLALQGYAAIGWNKPGVKKAPGNWLEQSMDDRAREAKQVIDYLKKEYKFNNIGLWGASQAGWVLPKIINDREDIKFAIFVSPAVNWIKQGQFATNKELASAKVNQEIKDEIISKNNESLKVILANKPYDDYLAITGEDNAMSKERYEFVKKNVNSDATQDLAKIKIPIMLVTGGKDLVVDTNNTISVYSKQVPSNLLTKVHVEGADHSMINTSKVNSNIKINFYAIFNPRALNDKEYLDAITSFIVQKG